jgi:hypothetical protein
MLSALTPTPSRHEPLLPRPLTLAVGRLAGNDDFMLPLYGLEMNPFLFLLI